LSQVLSPREAAASGKVRLEGDEDALDRFVEIFAWPPPVTLTAG
jgi:hypothetical protein